METSSYYELASTLIEESTKPHLNAGTNLNSNLKLKSDSEIKDSIATIRLTIVDDLGEEMSGYNSTSRYIIKHDDTLEDIQTGLYEVRELLSKQLLLIVIMTPFLKTLNKDYGNN